MSEEIVNTAADKESVSNTEKDKKLKVKDRLIDPERQKSWRRGKWTIEEEEYSSRLIEEFRNGVLHLEGGKTLRTYLSEKLNCDPMRISKKYTGCNSIGKQSFKRTSDAITIINREEKERIMSELAYLRKRFIDRITCNSKVDKKVRSSAMQGRNVSKCRKNMCSKASKVSRPETDYSNIGHEPKINLQLLQSQNRLNVSNVNRCETSSIPHQGSQSDNVLQRYGSSTYKGNVEKDVKIQYPVHITPVEVVPQSVPVTHDRQVSFDSANSFQCPNEYLTSSYEPIISETFFRRYHDAPSFSTPSRISDNFDRVIDSHVYSNGLSDRMKRNDLSAASDYNRTHSSFSCDQVSFDLKCPDARLENQHYAAPLLLDGTKKPNTIHQSNSVQDFINLIGDTDTRFLEQNFSLVIGSDQFPTGLPAPNEINYGYQAFPTDDYLPLANCTYLADDSSNCVYPLPYSCSLENITNIFPNDLPSVSDFSTEHSSLSNNSNFGLKRVSEESIKVSEANFNDRKKIKLEETFDF